jgi:hypothetical protein
MATVALVLAVALGSAVVWVMFAAEAPSPDTMDPPWWPGLQVTPTR